MFHPDAAVTLSAGSVPIPGSKSIELSSTVVKLIIILPFIESKEKVKEIIKNIVSGLKSDGCFYITLFGIKDAWIDKKNMSFWEYDEIKNILDSLDVNFYHNTIEEGYGRTMKGDIKYWNVFKFIYIKR